MTRSIKVIVGLALAGGLIAAVAVASGDGERTFRLAEAPADGAPTPRVKYRSKLCRQMACTAEQDAAVFDILVSHRDERKDNDESIREARKGFAPVYAADELDDAAIRGVFATISLSDDANNESAYEAIVQIHALLSPEQRAVFGEVIARSGPLRALSMSDDQPKKKKKAKKKAAPRTRDQGDRAVRDRAAGRGAADPRRGAPDSARRKPEPAVGTPI